MTVFVAAGCVDGFRGSNVQIDLSPGTPVQAHVMGTPAPGELPANSHFTIYAIDGETPGGAPTEAQLLEIARFEVHRIVDTTSPCFIDVGDHVPHPGLHVSAYQAKISEDTGISDIANPPPTATEQQKQMVATAMQRSMNVAALGSANGIKVVASASGAVYPGVASGCTGSGDLIPPANCTDDASNALRLSLCQKAWTADPALFEGTDRVLTAPLNGVTFGMVLGLNPINRAPVGGAQFFAENALDNVDAFAIYAQVDGVDGLGTQLYFGRPTSPTRGVLHVHLVSPANPLLTAEMAVFADLGEDGVHF